MSDSTIKHRSPFISAESLPIGASAESLADAGATIPGNAGEIWIYVPTGDSMHWTPNGTATSTFGHAVKAGNWFKLTHAQQGASIISDDAGNVTCIVVYMRGSGRVTGGTITAPY